MIQLNFSMQRPTDFLLPMEGEHRKGAMHSMGTELEQTAEKKAAAAKTRSRRRKRQRHRVNRH